MFFEQPPPGKRIVLFDDDPVYRSLMIRAAELNGSKLDAYESIDNIRPQDLVGKYDVVLLDYDLGHTTGPEIAAFLSEMCGDLPVLLISGVNRVDSKNKWPPAIQSFVLKSEGHQQALSAALECTRRRLSCIVSQAY